MLDALSNKQGNFCIAWDRKAGGGPKVYGLYPSAEDFYTHLLQNPPNKRFGYELIPENTPCKAYADIEWIGAPDPNHTLLKRLITFFREQAAEKYPDLPGHLEVYVACGSRPAEGERVKHSYHVTIHNLVFPCNHDDQMKQFFTLPSTSDYSEFYRSNAKGESKCIIDAGVYTRNRVFRLPYNMKRGGTVPLLRLSNDPYEDDFDGEFNNEDVDDVLPMVLTTIEHCADTYFVKMEAVQATVGEPASKKRKRNNSAVDDTDAKSKKIKKVKSTFVSTTADDHEGMSIALQQLLRDAGDNDSHLQPVQRDSRGYEQDAFYAQVRNAKHGRLCLAQPYACVVHKNNTARLYLTLQNKGYNVRFHCFSERCKTREDRKLGRLTKKGEEWRACCNVTPLGHTHVMAKSPEEEEGEDDEAMSDASVPAGDMIMADSAESAVEVDTVVPAAAVEAAGEGGKQQPDVDDSDPKTNGYAEDGDPKTNGYAEDGDPKTNGYAEHGDPKTIGYVEHGDSNTKGYAEDGDPKTNGYIEECLREVLLTAPLAWDSPKTERLMQLYKCVNPFDGCGALAEWCRRHDDWRSDNDFEQRFKDTQPLLLKSGVWTMLHRLRMEHPILLFGERCRDPVHLSEADEEELPPGVGERGDQSICIGQLLSSIQTRACSWAACTRVLKQLYPEDKTRVVRFVVMAYDIKEEAVEARWELKGSFTHEALDHFVTCGASNFKLVTEVVSRVFDGLPIRSYNLCNENTVLHISFDTVPKQETFLNLCNGCFTRGKDACIKLQGELFDCQHADAALADLLLRPTGGLHTCITDLLCYDEAAKQYREYQPSNGVWALIKEGAAVAIIAKAISALLWPMYHLQSFRELHDPLFNRKTPVVFPTSLTVKNMIGQYVQKMRNTKDVLNTMQQQLTFTSDVNAHPSLLCFRNGLLDLKTGLLLGPASPDMKITQCAPRVYDPTVDTTALAQLMQSFFPEACYPDSKDVLTFYQMWRGYCITGELDAQTSLWITGRGCNGKSVLAAIDKFVWGADICSAISMSAFQQAGNANNDHLYNSRNSRSVAIVENSDARQMNEEVFKKAVAGDEMSVQAKYKGGVTCRFPSKYTFYQNEAPLWTSINAFAIRRRIMNLPLLAQHLLPEQEQERLQLKTKGKEHCIIDRKDGFDIVTELKKNHVQAYMKWVVEGAMAFYANNSKFKVPGTVQTETIREGRDKKELMEQFLEEYLVHEHEACLSTNEIREVFLRHENFDVSVTASVENMLDVTIASKLVPDASSGRSPLISGVTKNKLTFPSRQAGCRPMGYRNVDWKAGAIAKVVNGVRKNYVNNTLPEISSECA